MSLGLSLAAVGGALGALAVPAAAAPIIGGTSTTVGQYPSVVAITVGGSLCTGTLITPVWVLTAAHCVDPVVLEMESQAAVTADTKVHFKTVDVRRNAGTVVKAVATIKDAQFDAELLGSDDIGLIKLERAVTDVLPSPINLDPAAAPVGTVVTIVGYGKTAGDESGSVGVQFELKNRTSISCSRIGESDADLLCFSQTDGRGSCSGDSGGPSFATIGGKSVVVGVTSFGDQDCAMFGGETRVDAERAFLVANIPELTGCVTDGDCASDRACFASRCIAEPFGPKGLGATCTSGADCESGQCGESGDDKLCSFTCSVTDATSCPSGFECRASNGSIGACWPPATGGESGGCDTGGASAPGAMLLGLVLVGLVWRRKRD